jgi:hypothetical protein
MHYAVLIIDTKAKKIGAGYVLNIEGNALT